MPHAPPETSLRTTWVGPPCCPGCMGGTPMSLWPPGAGGWGAAGWERTDASGRTGACGAGGGVGAGADGRTPAGGDLRGGRARAGACGRGRAGRAGAGGLEGPGGRQRAGGGLRGGEGPLQLAVRARGRFCRGCGLFRALGRRPERWPAGTRPRSGSPACRRRSRRLARPALRRLRRPRSRRTSRRT